MKPLFYIIIFLPLCCCSCHQPAAPKQHASYKDSLLKDYLSMADTLPYHDKNSVDFKMLRAYCQDDTAGLKRLQENMERANTEMGWPADTCIKKENIRNIKCREAYRFEYSDVFCPDATVETIINYGDSIVIRTVVYQHAQDSTPCKIIEQFSTTVDSVHWKEFQDLLAAADFWGLKPGNGKNGLDGNTLTVYGFKKGNDPNRDPDKWSFISRWGAGNTAIFKCFMWLFKVSKTRLPHDC